MAELKIDISSMWIDKLKSMPKSSGECIICGRKDHLTRHHIIKNRKQTIMRYSQHGHSFFIKSYENTIKMCSGCHYLYHHFYRDATYISFFQFVDAATEFFRTNRNF